jgi:hypothetical protein
MALESPALFSATMALSTMHRTSITTERADKLDDKMPVAGLMRQVRVISVETLTADKMETRLRLSRGYEYFARARFTMTEIPIALGIHMSKEQEH